MNAFLNTYSNFHAFSKTITFNTQQDMSMRQKQSGYFESKKIYFDSSLLDLNNNIILTQTHIYIHNKHKYM